MRRREPEVSCAYSRSWTAHATPRGGESRALWMQDVAPRASEHGNGRVAAGARNKAREREEREEQEKGSSGLHLFHVPSSLRSIHPSEQTSEQRDLTWSGRRMAAVLREEDGLHRRQGPLSLPRARSFDRNGKAAHAWNDKETADGRSMEWKNARAPTDDGGTTEGGRRGTDRKVAAPGGEGASEHDRQGRRKTHKRMLGSAERHNEGSTAILLLSSDRGCDARSRDSLSKEVCSNRAAMFMCAQQSLPLEMDSCSALRSASLGLNAHTSRAVAVIQESHRS